MSKPELDSYGGGVSITDTIHWAAKLGMMVADSENDGDSANALELRRAFERQLAEMPRTTMGNFYIFGDVAVAAYTQGYLRNTNAPR